MLPIAQVIAASAHGISGRRSEMERLIAEALAGNVDDEVRSLVRGAGTQRSNDLRLVMIAESRRRTRPRRTAPGRALTVLAGRQVGGVAGADPAPPLSRWPGAWPTTAPGCLRSCRSRVGRSSCWRSCWLSVTVPGAFLGVLLGSGDPVQAAAAQVLVLIGLLADPSARGRAQTCVCSSPRMWRPWRARDPGRGRRCRAGEDGANVGYGRPSSPTHLALRGPRRDRRVPGPLRAGVVPREGHRRGGRGVRLARGRPPGDPPPARPRAGGCGG